MFCVAFFVPARMDWGHSASLIELVLVVGTTITGDICFGILEERARCTLYDCLVYLVRLITLVSLAQVIRRGVLLELICDVILFRHSHAMLSSLY